MLQQTQVSVVIPYFERWMRLFPSVEALAKAPIATVLKEWEGLGYYARARNLHEGARYVMDQCQGTIPSSAEELKKIKGLGDYTVGAILSFAFHQRAAAVDGNVMRVLARYYALPDDISKVTTQKKLRGMAKDLLPEEEPWIIAEALIELGATICTRNPKCSECPLVRSCAGFAQGLANQLPVKSAKTVTQYLYRLVPVIACGDQFLVCRGVKGKVMADLLEFPYFDIDRPMENFTEEKRILREQLHTKLSLKATWHKTLPQVKHSFTRYRATLIPHLYTVENTTQIDGYEWLSINELNKYPFSAGHRRIFSELNS